MSTTITETVTAPTRTVDEPWTPERAASNGAVFLDEQRPGWADEVDVETLDVGWGNRCVLGQLYGGYRDGAAEFGLDFCTGRAVLLGFYADEDKGVRWDALTDAWKREIARRVQS